MLQCFAEMLPAWQNGDKQQLRLPLTELNHNSKQFSLTLHLYITLQVHFLCLHAYHTMQYLTPGGSHRATQITLGITEPHVPPYCSQCNIAHSGSSMYMSLIHCVCKVMTELAAPLPQASARNIYVDMMLKQCQKGCFS